MEFTGDSIEGKKWVYNQDINAYQLMQYKNCYISLTIVNCTYVAIIWFLYKIAIIFKQIIYLSIYSQQH